uniref:Ion transport domain-containing protein n=1 Tax=Amphiprion percula TaxID=161767 RepID=A0A3P8RQY9_AMPPE
MSLNVTERRRDVVLPILDRGDRDEEQLPYPALAPVVCLFLKQTTIPRNWCLKIVCGPYPFLLLEENLFDMCSSIRQVSQALDVFTFSYFVVEILSKTVALGLFGSSGSVLTNHWNTFDIFIIFAEIVDYILIDFGVNIEITHAIKPIRVISRVPALKDLVSVLLDILPMLGNVLILYAFVIHIFAVVGVQLWAGQLLNRCFLGEDLRTEKVPFICSPDASSGVRHCIDIPPYRVNGTTCTLTAPNESVDANSCINWNVYYNVCQPGNQNPNVGAINFDNIGYAWITIFQVVTLEGWTDIMHFFMDSYSFWSFVYFILVTIVSTHLLLLMF